MSVKVDQITAGYQDKLVLWEVDFTLHSNEIVGVIGPNGAGKSTLIKSMMGLLKPVSGSVSFFGEKLKDVRKRVAYVPQKGDIDWNFPITVFEVALMGRYQQLGFFKWARKKDKEKTYAMLDMMGLYAYRNQQIQELSGGQQQRLFLCRALLQDADVYFFDEPFAGVDMTTEKMIISEMKKLKELGKTVVVVHHDLSTTKAYFDKLVLLNNRLVAFGDVDEVFTKENLTKAYGNRASLLDEVIKRSQEKSKGVL